MNMFDDENKIIEYFQEVNPSCVCYLQKSFKIISFFKKIHLKENWSKWNNSSGKSDPPPDFYCDEFKLMMDVMRIDDHSFVNEKGKVTNRTNAGESRLRKEFEKNGFYEQLPNSKTLIINNHTLLPTEEDHNYAFYLSSFERTVKKHIQKIPLYKENHPDYKVVFFVLDESSSYMQVADDKLRDSMYLGQIIAAKPHLHFLDKDFIKVFEGSDIDYLIWYTPFKLTETDNGILDLPKVCVYQINDLDFQTISYEKSCMRSLEL